ncbi:CARDB domain-containing protein [Knoellia aerolata]|nr:CARDB domain-containing protein [Knoellia aerolata]
MPALIDLDTQVTFVTDPVNPCGGEDFTVTWQEVNLGDEASENYQDIFDMDDAGSGDSQTLDCDGLQPGQSATRTLTFNLPAGDYTMNVVVNARGPLFFGNVIIEDCE